MAQSAAPAGSLPAAPAAILFDVNETLSDLSPMRTRFADLGLDEGVAATWFASVLRDGMALSTVGEMAGFADIARAVLDPLLPADLEPARRGEAADHVLEGFLSLSVHPDVPDGLAALRDLGIRLLTLSNGAASVAAGLLERAGLADLVEATLSVADAGIWKPAGAAYAHGVAATGLTAAEHLLVAVHPWDIHGAQRAGLAGAWLDRTGRATYPGHFEAPRWRARDLVDLAAMLRDAAT